MAGKTGGQKPKIAVVDPTTIYEETGAHIAPQAERVQVIVRVPDFDALVAKRNPEFKAFASMYGPTDTEGHVHPDYRSAVLWGATERSKCNREGIAEGKAAVGTAGQPYPRNAYIKLGDGSLRPLTGSAGGGFGFTNEWLILAFATCEETLVDFEAQGCPSEMVVEELRTKVKRAQADRLQREARQNRSEGRQPQGRKPDVTYDEKPGDYDM